MSRFAQKLAGKETRKRKVFGRATIVYQSETIRFEMHRDGLLVRKRHQRLHKARKFSFTELLDLINGQPQLFNGKPQAHTD